MDLIERLINKDYLTERERKEWLGTIKERLEALEQENKDLKEIIEIRKQMNINLIDFGTKLKQENEKLKKIIKENFCYSPNALYDKVFFKWTGPVMEDEIIEVLGE